MATTIKEYSFDCDSLYDWEEYVMEGIQEVLEDAPVDENGMFYGDVEITVEYVPEDALRRTE